MASVLCFGLGYFIPERLHGHLLLGGAALLGLLWLSSVARGWSRWPLLQQAAGFTWGFLIGFCLLVSIQNARDSVSWPRLLPALVLIPLAVFIPIVPFWAIRRSRKATSPPTKDERQSPAVPDQLRGPPSNPLAARD
jgi:hypothetical protein